MDVLKKAKIPLIILMILIVGFVVYNKMFKKDPPKEGLTETAPNGNVAKPNQDFLPLLNLIKNVNFDDKFFNDVLFRSLVDKSIPVKEEKKGRDNPFAAGIVTEYIDGTAAAAESMIDIPPIGTTTPAQASTSTPGSTATTSAQ